MLRHGRVSDETFGGLAVTVELDREEDELVPPPGLGAGADIDDNDGYLSSSGSDEKLVSDPPHPVEMLSELGGDGGSGGEKLEPSLDGNPLLGHKSRDHWPYDAGCGACVQTRGRSLLDGFGMMLNQKALDLIFCSLRMESTGRYSSS